MDIAVPRRANHRGSRFFDTPNIISGPATFNFLREQTPFDFHFYACFLYKWVIIQYRFHPGQHSAATGTYQNISVSLHQHIECYMPATFNLLREKTPFDFHFYACFLYNWVIIQYRFHPGQHIAATGTYFRTYPGSVQLVYGASIFIWKDVDPDK